MLNGNTEQMFTSIRTDIRAVAVGLFLVIILDFPTNIVLGYDRKGGDVRKVCWVY